ncbi:MAG: wax ester/triacylglycerol synthase family O-acyltransferase [Actinomycetota bacterium]
MGHDRLTAADAAFLRIETEHEPQHVGSLSILEGAPLRDPDGRIRLDELRAHIGGRLQRVPRLRQRVMEVPYSQGRPIWVDDDNFDVDYHVRLTALPKPGGEDQLLELMGRLQSLPLDRDRPLWELWFVDALAGDDVAMILKVHHALGDGIANVDVAVALVDLEPVGFDTEPAPPWEPAAAPSPAQLLADTWWDNAQQPQRLARHLLRAMRNPAPAQQAVKDVVRTAADFTRSATPAPWNVAVSPHRRWVHADVALSAVRRIREDRDVTINDVVLAACTGALRSFMIARGESVDGRELKAMVPVSRRTEGEHGATLGNRISLLVVDLPVDEADPVTRLDELHRRVAERKTSGVVDGAEAIVRLADGIPMLATPLTRLVSHRIPMNLVITNVPGPPMPLFLAGARVQRAYPYVEVIDDEGLTIAVVSYDDTLHFGITADRDVLPDLGDVARSIEAELATLEALVGS